MTPSDFEQDNRRQTRSRISAAVCSLVVGFVLLALKFGAWRLTLSAAVLSDALESIVNVVAAAFALVSIILAAKPPDTDHPYGHGKIEYFSAGFEGALIVLAAIGIFKVGLHQIATPHPLPSLDTGMLILIGASVGNLLLGIALIRVGRRTDSLTLVADGKHVLTDVYTSVGVILGLLLVRFTGWLWMDGAVACVMGLNILVTGFMLIRQSFSGLMDAADPAILKRIATVLTAARRPAWIDIHQLRAWRSGRIVHLDLHLSLPRDVTLEAAHDEAKALEAALIGSFDGYASVVVHMDPCEDDDCGVCPRDPCEERTAANGEQPQWTSETLTRFHAGVDGKTGQNSKAQ
ncbi:MAG: cation diffusion facilitator family transporter [Pseudomonadota bacterium]